MRSHLALVALAVGAACTDTSDAADTIAQLQAKLPPCSVECIAQGAVAHNCSLTDIACQCTKTEEITKTVSPCLVRAGCGLEDITDTATAVAGICESLGVIPGNGTSSTGGGETETSAAAAATPSSDAPGYVQTTGLLPILGLTAAAVSLL